jgi:hypothetical protein
LSTGVIFDAFSILPNQYFDIYIPLATGANTPFHLTLVLFNKVSTYLSSEAVLKLTAFSGDHSTALTSYTLAPEDLAIALGRNG